jgi:hypothetical protein
MNYWEGSDDNNYYWSQELNPITNGTQETGYAPYALDIGSYAFQYQGAGDATILGMHFQKPSTFVYLNMLMVLSVIFELALLNTVIQRGKKRWGNRTAAVVGILLLAFFLMSLCLFIFRTPSVMKDDAMMSAQNYRTSFIEPEHDFPTNQFEGSFEQKVIIYNGYFNIKQTWGFDSGLILLWSALITELLVVAILMIGIAKEKPHRPKPSRPKPAKKMIPLTIDQMPYPPPYFGTTVGIIKETAPLMNEKTRPPAPRRRKEVR